MSKISLKALVIGNIIGLFLDNDDPFMHDIQQDAQSDPGDRGLAFVQIMINQDFLWLAVVSIISMTITGYIAGRIAKQNKISNGTLASLLPALFTFWSVVHSAPQATQIISLILMPLLATLGGYLAQRQSDRKNKVASGLS